MKLSVEGTGAQEQQVAEEAKRLGGRVEELAAAAVQDLLAQPDPAVQQAASRVLEKNRELYRRLASCAISRCLKTWTYTAGSWNRAVDHSWSGIWGR